jgi:hypothetical protein
VRLEGLDLLKNPMISSGIERATFRLITYATACPVRSVVLLEFCILGYDPFFLLFHRRTLTYLFHDSSFAKKTTFKSTKISSPAVLPSSGCKTTALQKHSSHDIKAYM